MRLRRRRGKESPWAFFKDYRYVIRYARPHRRLAFASLSMVVVGSAVALLTPWPLAILVDSILGNKPLPSLLGFLDGVEVYGLLTIAVLGGLALTAIEHGLAVVDEYVSTSLDQRMVLDLRSDMFRHAHGLSLDFHDRTKTGNLMYQINNQAAAVGSIMVSVPPVLQSILTLVGMFAVTYIIQPTLAMLAMSVVPFIYYSTGFYARRIQPRVLHVRALEGQSLSIVHEAMAMLRVIMAFGRESYEYKRFREQAEVAVDARVDLTVRQTVFSLAVTMITAIGTALVLGFGAHYVLQDEMSVGELLVVMGYVVSLYKPLEQISSTVSSLQEQFLGLRYALDLLETRPQVVEQPDAKDISGVAGEVVVEDADFHYPGRSGTLKGVSLTARAGDRIAVVGPTGAGKSTLLGLLLRFYDPQKGRVLLDGHDLRDLTLHSLRAQFSLVMQEPLLFAGSIGENIRYGRLEASDEELIEAARAANAHDFISRLPKGYDTLIGERGAQLSGGERQRIAVARAFLKQAPILILDEPTSSIDSKTEAVILDALERLMEGRTTFMVAHRLSTIQGADLVLVVNDGEIIERGTHEQLRAMNGLYEQLYLAQQGAGRRRASASVAPAKLAEMTAAIATAQENGGHLTGPALAEMARAMASFDSSSEGGPTRGEESAWALAHAVWALMRDGDDGALQAMAARGPDDPAGATARSLLRDLGVEETAHLGPVTGSAYDPGGTINGRSRFRPSINGHDGETAPGSPSAHGLRAALTALDDELRRLEDFARRS